MTQRILLIDDDADVVAHLRRNLEAVGFEVVVATDEDAALAHADVGRVDLVVLDVMMPGGDGFAVLGRLLVHPATATTPLIVLTAEARPGDRVRALRLGADDYVVKPYDVDEVLARVRAVLRRARQMRDLSPLTGLPGNTAITMELAARVAGGDHFAVAHVDIDNFKAFNDSYGFLRGDAVITFCAACLREALGGVAAGFLGHIGGDDFVAILPWEEVAAFCERAIAAWDAGITAFYDPADATAGGVEVPDRRGDLQWYPVATLSIGVATNRHRAFASEWEASAVAAEMKEHAKRQPGSNAQIDRRT